MTDITVVPVSPRTTDIRIEACEKLSIALPGYSPADVMDRLNNGAWSLWRMQVYGEKPHTVYFTIEFTSEGLLIPALVGAHRDEWLSYIERWTEDYARVNGFKQVMFYGRKGWFRDAEKRGWEHGRAIFTRPVRKGL